MDSQTVTRFWAGELPAVAGQRVVAALFAGDPVAMATTLALRAGPGQPVPESAADDHFAERWQRAFRDALAAASKPRPRPALPAAFLELSTSTEASLSAIIATLPTRDDGMCDAIIAASYECRWQDAQRSWRLAEVAAELARDLVKAAPSRASYQRLGRAQSELCRARRLVTDLPGADVALEAATIAFELGNGDPIDAFVLLERRALLALDHDRPKEALREIRRASRLAKDLGEPSLQVQALVTSSLFLHELDRHDEAIAALRSAAALLGPSADPRARLAVHHNLVLQLLGQDRHAEAASLLPGLRLLTEAHGSRSDRLDLLWLEGRTALANNNPWAAAERLATVRLELSGEERAIDLGLVTLELSLARLQLGDVYLSHSLAREAMTILHATDLHLASATAQLLALSTRDLESSVFYDSLVREVARLRSPRRRR